MKAAGSVVRVVSFNRGRVAWAVRVPGRTAARNRPALPVSPSQVLGAGGAWPRSQRAGWSARGRRGAAPAPQPQSTARACPSGLRKKLLVLVGAGPAGRAALLLWSGCLAGAAPLPGPPPARGGPPLPAALSGFRGVAGRLARRGRAVVGLGVSSGPCWPLGPVCGPGVGGLARARPLGVCLAPLCPAPACPPATPRAWAACLVACCLAHRVGAGLLVARWPLARQPAAVVRVRFYRTKNRVKNPQNPPRTSKKKLGQKGGS